MSLFLIYSILLKSLKYCCKLFLLSSAIIFFCLFAIKLLISMRKLQLWGYLIEGNLLINIWVNKKIPAEVLKIICSVCWPSTCYRPYSPVSYIQCMAFSYLHFLWPQFGSQIYECFPCFIDSLCLSEIPYCYLSTVRRG